MASREAARATSLLGVDDQFHSIAVRDSRTRAGGCVQDEHNAIQLLGFHGAGISR
jgi:hypothetical protein